MALSQIKKITTEFDQRWLKTKNKIEKRLQKLLGIQHLVFIHAKQLEIDFFCHKMAESFVFTPVGTNIMRKHGRQRVAKILKKTLYIPTYM